MSMLCMFAINYYYKMLLILDVAVVVHLILLPFQASSKTIATFVFRFPFFNNLNFVADVFLFFFSFGINVACLIWTPMVTSIHGLIELSCSYILRVEMFLEKNIWTSYKCKIF